MENKSDLTISDVERNKELFEYEMTEVVLQLKGEFAKVSGKDLNLEDTQFTMQKLDIQADIPDVVVAPPEIELTALNPISVDNFVIPDVSVNEIIFAENLAESAPVSDPCTVSLASACPVITKFDEVNLKTAEIKLPTVSEAASESAINIPCGKLPDVVTSSVDVKFSDVTVKLSPLQTVQLNPVTVTSKDEHPYHPMNMESFAKINVPDLDVVVSDSDMKIDFPAVQMSVQTEPVHLNVSTGATVRLSPLQTVQLNPVTVTSKDEHPYHPMNMESFAKISVPDLDVTVSDSDMKIDFPAVQVSVQTKPIHLDMSTDSAVNLGVLAEHVNPSLSLPKVNVDIPCVSRISVVPVKTLDLTEKTSSISEVHVPAIKTDSAKDTKIDIVSVGVGFECPAIPFSVLPTVSVSQMKKIVIPEKVDFSSDIQKIINSAISVRNE